MTVDVLDPGPAGDFPHVPRTPAGYMDTNLMPTGLARQAGEVIDLTPYTRDGRRLEDILAAQVLARLTAGE